jgi:RNA polymerase sigma-54 factor
MMKQGLQLKFSQNLALTPQLQQSIRLLQLSTQELNQELEAILEANPLLERVEGSADGLSGSGSEESYSEAPPAERESVSQQEESEVRENFADDLLEFGGNSRWDEGGASGDDDGDYNFQEPTSTTLREYLLEQLSLLQLSERDFLLARYLIDNINEDGYLEQTPEEIIDALGEDTEFEIDILELQTALKHIQHLDPPGVGATSLSDCLCLQLAAMDEDTPHLGVAMMLAKNHLSLLASRDFARLRKQLGCSEESLRGAQQLITQLNPRPGSEFARISTDHFIQHEVIVKKVKGIWLASLNEDVMPKLRINQMYANILRRNRENSGQYLNSQMQEAKWMIKNIQQRFSTILRVSQAIVDRQRNFFEHGEIAMRPLVLREIAEELDLHESTISRVTTHKYMLTPRGVYELKYFFGSHVSTEAGGECSATAIRALIKQMVAEENTRKPLSDNQIADILGKQGIVVARRTIAKYRESLNIPPASQRKSI